jgi:hypothetical protein
MSAWAAVAVKEAAITTSAGAGVLHGIAPGALDGFAAGALLTGVCFLVIVAPRTLRRSRLSARESIWSGNTRHVHGKQPDYFATPADTHSLASSDAYSPASPGSLASPGTYSPAPSDTCSLAATDPDFAVDAGFANPFAPASERLVPKAGADPYAVDPDDDDVVVLPDDSAAARESGRSGYLSKHRSIGPENSDRRQESRRRQPRHAAPSAGFASRVSARLAVTPMLARS